ncbi:MAG: hemolysin family protein [Acidimicrobiales bacterium]|jgi:putative hemolysin
MTGDINMLLAAAKFRADDLILIVVVILLLGGSAVLALAETSLVRTSRAKALALEDERHRGARQLVRLVEHPETFLNGVLLVVLVCQLVTATLVGLLAEEWFGGWGVFVALIFEIVVIFVLAEAIPKNYAVRNPDRSALFSAPFVAVVVRFWPVRMLSNALVWLAEKISGGPTGAATVSESELLAMADVATEEEVIEHSERVLIHSIIEFGDTVVREVMVPRPDMHAVEADMSVSDALGEAMDDGFSRMPVYDGNIDDVVGIAYAKDLMRAERASRGGELVGSHVREARFVPETKRVASLMREMQELKYHLAIVVDEYGGTAGLVTLEDLIEELVGEIVDEYDMEEPQVERLPDGEVSVSARLGVDELAELLDTELPTGSWDTVGGLVFDRLGHVPEQGEAVVVDGLRLVAERVEGNRIGRVRVGQAVTSAPGDEKTHSEQNGSS